MSEIAVVAPPPLPRPSRGDLIARLLPVVMAAGMIAALAVVYRSGSSPTRNPVLLILPALMLVSASITAVAKRGARTDIDDDRDDYLAYLSGLRDDVTDTATAQRDALHEAHPDPAALWMLVGTPAMWHRRSGDPDFGRVRVGLGTVGLATRLVAPQRDRTHRVDPVTDTALRCFLATHASLADVPVTVDLLQPGVLTLGGDPDLARGLLRAIICQLAVQHGPDLVAITSLADDDRRQHWEWLKWLPHQSNSISRDGRHLVVAVDGADHPPGIGRQTIVEIGGPTSEVVADLPDWLALTDALVCARRLAAHRAASPLGTEQDWPALVGLADIDGFDPRTEWADRQPEERLLVPIGTDAAGRPVLLDLKEAAEHGSGPHGLCIGATGSGKSELLRTLVLALMARHPPEAVNLVLVDFKGGATFLGLERAAHVAAVITNLADEAPLVDRMRDALAGEMNRRQELLRAAGSFAGVAAYEEARRAGAPLAALPALLVIVDEFSELLSRHPDFIDTFTALGRLGRSLGIHLLLASQRLDEGRLRGLESHLSYRICLKTLSANESRMVLGVPDAHQLPSTPGLGYLRTADGELVGFRAAYVSGPYRQSPSDAVRLFTGAPVAPTGGPDRRTVLQAMLDRLAGHGPRARRVWLAPLHESPPLETLLGTELPALVVPIGVVDRPFEQRRTPLLVDVRGAAGHVAVVGAPQSGKSTVLAAWITALASSNDTARVQLYGLDFGGGTLSALQTVPHVGSVAGHAEPELVRRIVDEMAAILARREASPADADDPDIFLVIDGWASLCRDFDALEAPILALADRGLSYRVHVVLTATRWAEIRPALRDLVGTRIELRLGEPADSELDRRAAAQVPRGRPGRGLTDGGLHTLIAWPCAELPDRGGVPAPPVPLLPATVHRDTLLTTSAPRPMLGIEERELGVVTPDFGRQPHLLILGDAECGKTATLRTLCRELTRTGTPEQVRLIVVDYRRGLLDVIESQAEHVAGYAASAPALADLLPGLLDRLAQRLPGPDVKLSQLRDRSWWSGPAFYLLIDDYHLVNGDALTPLLDYLPYAADIGLHLVVARRSAGAARAMYDPLPTALREHGAMGLVMSGSPDEGPLFGSIRSAPLPPGRGILLTRSGGEQLIQVAWSP